MNKSNAVSNSEVYFQTRELQCYRPCGANKYYDVLPDIVADGIRMAA